MSNSNYAAPIFLVNRKDGSHRMCCDYRLLNKATNVSAYPLPKTDDIFLYLNQVKYVTGLDLLSGYWALKIKEEDKPKTAFITANGLYQRIAWHLDYREPLQLFRDVWAKFSPDSSGKV